ncbi:PLDc N-terminal domain-containing protein [uncultured Agrococcus sp.]|uniref:PLDc N-terminal domain-containing protein n=1 Tax=uncultured Agrococcus sp. TaxID=382258 RepID=UPI0025FC1E04|nr:PLDc N-terminal domain-containing protein [uncultured Agrococcus sp.]
MADAVNPLIPAGYDILWTSVAVLHIAVVVAAIVSIVRHAKHLDTPAYVLWILAVLAMPVIGVALWFAFGCPKVRESLSPTA